MCCTNNGHATPLTPRLGQAAAALLSSLQFLSILGFFTFYYSKQIFGPWPGRCPSLKAWEGPREAAPSFPGSPGSGHTPSDSAVPSRRGRGREEGVSARTPKSSRTAINSVMTRQGQACTLPSRPSGVTNAAVICGRATRVVNRVTTTLGGSKPLLPCSQTCSCPPWAQTRSTTSEENPRRAQTLPPPATLSRRPPHREGPWRGLSHSDVNIPETTSGVSSQTSGRP